MSKLIPPYSQTAEETLLGTLLQHNEIFDDVAALVDTQDFYHAINRDIFELAKTKIRAKQPADLATIGGDDRIDYAYCIGIMRLSGAPQNALVYAQTVKNKSIQRQIIAASHAIHESAYKQTDNVIELVANAAQMLSKVSESITKIEVDTSAEAALKETYEQLKEMVNADGSLIGISTGFPDLDKRSSGLKKATLTLIAARPGMGKTTFALNLIEHEALNGGFPIMFSLEMSKVQIMQKMLSSVGNVPLQAILNPKGLDDYQWAGISEAMKTLKASKLHIIDDSSMTIDLMRYECRRYLKNVGKLSLIVVDYLQLIIPTKSENRTQEISQISRDLKAISKEFDVPVVALSQLSRKVEERAIKRPMKSDLRESGSLEQDADEIIFIYREDYYDENSPNEDLAEIILSKARMGIPGTVVTEFNGAFSRFSPSNQTIKEKSKAKPYAERFSA